MNFLAHYALLRPTDPSPELALGNALPDLLPLAAPRARFRLSTLADAPPGPAREGVRQHLAADAAFHRLPAFAEAQTEMKALLGKTEFTGMRLRPFFLAHVLAELALDAALLRADGGLADAFYAACDAADFWDMTRWAEAALHRPLPGLPGALTRFSRSRYLAHYAEDRGVAEGLSHLCARARQDTFEGANLALLTALVAQAVPRMASLAPVLLAETSLAP